MKVQEMHIGIDVELQKLNSNVTKNILPQEKDWFINKEVLKYINKKINPDSNIQKAGFEDNTKRLRDLDSLIVSTEDLTTEINDEGNTVIALPSDFYSYVGTDVRIAKECSTSIVNPTVKEYRTQFNASVNVNVLTSYKITIDLTSGTKTLFDSAVDLPSGYLKSLDFKQQAFMLQKALNIILPINLKKYLTSPFDLYWEFDRTGYISNSFILYTTDQVFKLVTTFNGVATNVTPTTDTINSFNKDSYPINSRVRLIDNEFFTDNVNSHLSNSSANSPICRQLQQSIEIKSIKGYVIGNCKLTYISKPLLSDVLLNNSVNMNRNSLNEILVATVAYIKGVISSPDYKVYKAENMLIE